MLNCILLIEFYDSVLSKVMFSPNFLFFPFSPFGFLPHLQTLPLCKMDNWFQAQLLKTEIVAHPAWFYFYFTVSLPDYLERMMLFSVGLSEMIAFESLITQNQLTKRFLPL